MNFLQIVVFDFKTFQHRYGRKIWLTEFALCCTHDVQDVKNFVRVILSKIMIGQICSFSPLLPQQQLFSFPLIFFAFAFDYLFTLLYIPYSVYPCFPEYCRYFINIVFAKNCIKIKGIIPRLEEADFVYRYSWFITRYKNLIF